MVSLDWLFFGFSLLCTIIYLFILWTDERNRREYASRNVQYIPQKNVFPQALSKQRSELPRHELIKKKGKVFGFNFLGAYTILVAEPELAQLVLSKEFTNFTNRRTFDIDDPTFRNSLSTVKDEKWKRLRAIVSPTFSTGKLRRMKPMIDDTVRTLLKNMDEAIIQDSNVNVKQIYGFYTMDTIIQVAFGTKVDSLVEQDNPVIGYAKRLFSVDMPLINILKFTLLLMTPKIAKAFKIRLIPDVTDFFHSFSMKIIERKRSEMKENYGKANSFIELLLEAEVEQEMDNGNGSVEKQESGFTPKMKYITNEEIVANCIIFISAGYDTTATTITMASYLLSLNSQIQEKLYQEILDVIGKLSEEAGSNGPKDPVELITMDSLSRFEYLNAVVNETLRIYSPATFTEREVSKDMVLETEDSRVKINVKKGDVVHFPIYSMHRDPEQFPEPEKFDPERFIGSPTFHKYSYLPFGSGPRNCVAKSFSLMEAKLALLHTVRLYNLTVCPQTNIPPEFYFNTQVMVPRDIILNVQKRSNSYNN